MFGALWILAGILAKLYPKSLILLTLRSLRAYNPQPLGGILAGILGQGFGKGVENVDSKDVTNIAHNQRMYQKETARLINSSKELTLAAKAELAVRNAQVKSVEQAIAVQADVKKAIEERIEALSTERKLSRQVTEAMARYKEASDQATKTLNERKDANKIITEEVANKLRNELSAQGDLLRNRARLLQ